MRPSDVDYIFAHTAQTSARNVDRDEIDRWHRARKPPFRCIGYHFVILDDRHDALPDGTIQSGRALIEPGAHVYGVNSRSIGICVVGDGNRRRWTKAQLDSFISLYMRLHALGYKVPVSRVLGHREVNLLVDRGEVPAVINGISVRTDKDCPGTLVNMDEIRQQLVVMPDDLPEPEIDIIEAVEKWYGKSLKGEVDEV